jgi:hypothetical protein
MANTVIQIKRSTVTTAPTAGSLSAAEPAYSYLSDKLFIGSSDGSQVIEIGGRYYVNTAIQAFSAANTANDRAVAAFTAANSYSNVYATIAGANSAVGAGANAFATASIAGVGAGSNNYLLAVIAGANTAVGAGANAFASATIAGANTAVGAGANAFSAATIAGANTAVGAGANAFATAASTGANNYLLAVIAGANTAVGAGANAFSAATIAGANTAVGAGANAFATAAAAGANNYADGTFIKRVAANQTITGNLAITGSLTVSGNAFTIDTETLRVSDPLIYLAGNNYTSDIVDIGFVGNYNTGSANLHTGIFRDATIKEYYVFDGYDKEPIPNHIDTTANGFSLAVLNATLRTSNLILGGANAILTIAGVGTAANAFAAATIAGANTAVGAGANAFSAATIAGANSYLISIIAGANTAVGAGANAFAAATIAGANTAVGAGANNYLLAVIAGANTAVGAGANNYLIPIINAANTNASNGTYITTGVVGVSVGGTGRTTFANNGILFGNTTSGIRVTAAGIEGNVLQVNAQGTPLFGMLDGGTF